MEIHIKINELKSDIQKRISRLSEIIKEETRKTLVRVVDILNKENREYNNTSLFWKLFWYWNTAVYKDDYTIEDIQCDMSGDAIFYKRYIIWHEYDNRYSYVSNSAYYYIKQRKRLLLMLDLLNKDRFQDKVAINEEEFKLIYT